MNRPKTHLELKKTMLESVHELMAEIDRKNRELKKAKDYDEVTQAHNTKRLIQKWLNLEELKY